MRNVLALFLVLVIGSCQNEGSGPTGPAGPEGPAPASGMLSVQLTSPNVNDGGVMFTVSGGTITSVSSSSYTIYTAEPSTSIRKVVVVGNVTSGILVTIAVPDVSRVGQYTAVLEQASARDTYAQQNLSAYSLQVVP
jgi:hypothetical protein